MFLMTNFRPNRQKVNLRGITVTFIACKRNRICFPRHKEFKYDAIRSVLLRNSTNCFVPFVPDVLAISTVELAVKKNTEN